MEIAVIRHGETLENIEHICQGQSHGTLSPLGREQARQLRESLTGESFDLVIASDLRRAIDTAEIIFSGSGVRIEHDARLRERGLLPLEGGKLDSSVNYCAHIDGCESMESMFSRVRSLLSEMESLHANKRVALVTHGLTIRVITSICQGVDIADTKVVKNCSLIKFKGWQR
ncbi:MAG: histidine phosphatase family protein [Rikenellaceae bacterium]